MGAQGRGQGASSRRRRPLLAFKKRERAGILLYPLGQKYSLLNKVFMSRFELVFTKIAARLDSTDK